MQNKYKIYICIYIGIHNVKEKETEFGHVSVTGEKKKNKHMLVVSDTSFCSNNFKNVWFIFKTKFCWHSLDAAVEIISLFWKKKNNTYMTKLLHCSRTESNCTYALSLFSSKMLVEIFRAYSQIAVYFLTLTQNCSGIRISKGLHDYPSPDDVHGNHWT